MLGISPNIFCAKRHWIFLVRFPLVLVNNGARFLGADEWFGALWAAYFSWTTIGVYSFPLQGTCFGANGSRFRILWDFSYAWRALGFRIIPLVNELDRLRCAVLLFKNMKLLLVDWAVPTEVACQVKCSHARISKHFTKSGKVRQSAYTNIYNLKVSTKTFLISKQSF